MSVQSLAQQRGLPREWEERESDGADKKRREEKDDGLLRSI